MACLQLQAFDDALQRRAPGRIERHAGGFLVKAGKQVGDAHATVVAVGAPGAVSGERGALDGERVGIGAAQLAMASSSAPLSVRRARM